MCPVQTIDYDAWARTYDETRGASPSVITPLLAALGDAGGRSLLDIGGGTGNVAVPLAEAGFRVALCDFSSAMARRAAAKLREPLLVAVADAQRLPFRDDAFDCAICVNVLGHVPGWRGALAEARRVLSDGPLVIKVSTDETLQANWVTEYIPVRLYAPPYHYQPEQVLTAALRDAGFGRVTTVRIHYQDPADGSIQALKHFPEAFLDDARVMNMAVFQRLPPDVQREGIDAIRRDYRSGSLQAVMARFEPLSRRYGDGTIFVAWP